MDGFVVPVQKSWKKEDWLISVQVTRTRVFEIVISYYYHRFNVWECLLFAFLQRLQNLDPPLSSNFATAITGENILVIMLGFLRLLRICCPLYIICHVISTGVRDRVHNGNVPEKCSRIKDANIRAFWNLQNELLKPCTTLLIHGIKY